MLQRSRSRLLTVSFLLGFLFLSVNASAQNITLSVKSAKLERVLQEIEKQSNYSFIYSQTLIRQAQVVNLDVKNEKIENVLKQLFQNQPFTYSVSGRFIAIRQKENRPDAGRAEKGITIQGKVVDEKGNPVPAASVVIPGTPFGTVTSQNGEYTLVNVPGEAEIVFSYVGYEMQRFKIAGREKIDIVLKAAVSGLNETIVIGYGTTTKVRNTGSISSITSEEIAKQPVANPLNALQGRVAGALVTQANGLPGSRVTIVVRGLNTLDATGAGSQPLYIVDGVPFNIMDGSVPVTNDLNGRGSFAANGGISPFSIINPAEIERIDILKDADATAIYGTRGANGVVLITTKKGLAGKTKLDVNVYRGAGKVGHFIPMMNTAQYLQMRKEAYANDGITPTAANAPDLLLWDQTGNTNWQKKYMGGTANATDAQATVSGGDQRTRFLLNAGYHKETTVFPGDFNDYRISTRMNAEHNSLNKKFNASVSVNYSYGESNLLQQDMSTLYNLPPNMPLYNANGNLVWTGNFTNPESYLLTKYIGKTNNLMTNTVLRYTILPGLDIKTSFGYNSITLNQNTQLPATSKSPLSGTPTNSATFRTLEQKGYIVEPQLTYNASISRGRLSALLGSTFMHNLNTSFGINGDNYSTPALLGTLVGAGTYSTPTNGYTLYRFTSLFGRVTYDWDARYVFNGVLRKDGSSRFGPDNRFGTFWSLGAGWVFSNESFAKSLPWLSFGKLRSSYGVTGNDQIGDYQYRNLYTSSAAYQGGAALSPSRVENPSLQWQTTYKLEFGLELGFLNNAVQMTANHYRNRTPNQLGFLTMASQAGFNSYSANFDALIRNTGFELELNTTNIRRKDFKWSSSFNMTIPRTKVVDASKSYFFYNANAIGQQLSYVMRYQYRGVDPATGKPMYYNAVKDSLTFTPNFSTDRAVAGYTAPKAYGGLNNVITYKGFDLSFFFQYTIQDATNVLPLNAPGVLSNGNQPTFWLDRWQKPGDITTVPRYSSASTIYSAYSSSDAVFGNASLLRLRNVNLSYAFPKQIAERLKTDNLRVYLQGQNLWWTSKQKYVYDPETGTAMPPLRVITAGINVTL